MFVLQTMKIRILEVRVTIIVPRLRWLPSLVG